MAYSARGRNGELHPILSVDEDRGLACPICERDRIPTGFMSNHHLRTKSVDRNLILYVCRDCHGFIHALFTNRQLADPRKNLDNLEGLLARAEFVKAVSFIRSVPVGRKVAIEASNERRNKSRGRKDKLRGGRRR
jgi:hypothetical protein